MTLILDFTDIHLPEMRLTEACAMASYSILRTAPKDSSLGLENLCNVFKNILGEAELNFSPTFNLEPHILSLVKQFNSLGKWMPLSNLQC